MTTKRVERIPRKEEILWADRYFELKGIPSSSSENCVNNNCHVDIQSILDRRSIVFGDMPKGSYYRTRTWFLLTPMHI